MAAFQEAPRWGCLDDSANSILKGEETARPQGPPQLTPAWVHDSCSVTSGA